MNILCGLSSGKKIELKSKIASGGEGSIWTTNNKDCVAKVYKSLVPVQIEKLQIMIDNPPQDPMLSRGHQSIAWPQELIKDSSKNEIVGFLMPTIKKSKTLINIYNCAKRKKQAPGLNWFHLHIIAENVATVVEAIHQKQYVIGDIKPQNFLVPVDSLYVSIVDTDSFKIRDPLTKKIYPCPVGTLEYSPPELHNQNLQVENFEAIDRFEVHDRFGLAVIIYLILFGEHPFSGKWKEQNNQPEMDSLETRISQGYWAYAPKSLIGPRKLSIPFKIVHPKMQEYFQKCFTVGHENPHLRPTAGEWRQALKLARQNLTECSVGSSHFYSKAYNKCYWCEVQSQIDYFPPLTNFQNTQQSASVSRPVNINTQPPTSYRSSDKKNTIAKIILGTLLGLILLGGISPVRNNITLPIIKTIANLLE